jgi:hypothetical protein
MPQKFQKPTFLFLRKKLVGGRSLECQPGFATYRDWVLECFLVYLTNAFSPEGFM